MIVNSKKFITIFKNNNLLPTLNKFLHNITEHPDRDNLITAQDGYEIYLLFSMQNMRITIIPFPTKFEPEEVYNTLKKSLHLEHAICCKFYSIIREISH